MISSMMQDRESCINNVKLHSKRCEVRPIDNKTYTRRPRDKLQRSSLENISTDPWGNHLEAQSSLRRTRSLALTRDDIFTNLDISNGKSRRSQLIPRAKLIGKEPRYGALKGHGVESLQSTDRVAIKKKSNFNSPDYSPLPPPRNRKNLSASIRTAYSSINNSTAGPKFLIGGEHDSLNSNYYKTSINTICRVESSEDLQLLSLPNYYPDPKYDTDNISLSLTDEISSDSNSKKYSSCDNIYENRLISNEPESISYDENIVLTTNRPLYDSIRERYAKPRTIRGSTPYHRKNQIYFKEKSIDTTDYTKESDKISLEYFETNSNLDEIKLNNENITKDEQYKTIVVVEPPEESEEEKNKHSHNYLREFLESQKGSKRPLQNFIIKKLSNLSRKNSNLAENRFYSLPDISASKNLRKCEKIDRKLRKCEKSNDNESRFIVNIGKHFDLTTNTNSPVDFELKISKVPKKNINKEFLEAVKDLNETLNKPEIISVTEKEEKMEDRECFKEYQEKLGTIKNYWDKMIGGQDKEKCKIVEIQTKIEDVKKKFELGNMEDEKPSKVQQAKQIFEKKAEKNGKMSTYIKEACSYLENKDLSSNQFESLNANVVEIISKDKNNGHRAASNSKSTKEPEFDHVRYRVVRSDLFQKKIFANCEKESQFDGLMQYLQDYSFQELLRDNNIVIIEPIRTKIPYETTKSNRIAKNITPLVHKFKSDTTESNAVKRHFFYHPIRVNKEVNEDELPNPDTVKQVRQFFEGGLERSQSSQEFEGITSLQYQNVDPDKDRCSATESNPSNTGSQENLFDSIGEHCYDQQYVSEDIMKKIRECGTTVTYYGGRMVDKQTGQPVLTKVIMEEIKNNEKRNNDRNNFNTTDDNKDYQGVKFRLVKSNSCNSRLELIGTNDLNASKQKYIKRKQLMTENKLSEESERRVDKNTINEQIKNSLEENQPRIIGEERKMTQWKDLNKNFIGLNFNEKAKNKVNYDYHDFEKVSKSTKTDDMEFEPYEVA